MIARTDPGIGALQAVEANQVEPFVLGIGIDRAGRRRAFADDLDHVAFAKAHRGHDRTGHVRQAASRILGPGIGDL